MCQRKKLQYATLIVTMMNFIHLGFTNNKYIGASSPPIFITSFANGAGNTLGFRLRNSANKFKVGRRHTWLRLNDCGPVVMTRTRLTSLSVLALVEEAEKTELRQGMPQSSSEHRGRVSNPSNATIRHTNITIRN